MGCASGRCRFFLTGESFPLHLDVVVQGCDNVRFPLPPDMTMTHHETVIATNVPNCLILSERTASSNDWPSIAVFHACEVLVIQRDQDMTGSDVKAAAMQVGQELDDGPCVTFWDVQSRMMLHHSMSCLCPKDRGSLTCGNWQGHPCSFDHKLSHSLHPVSCQVGDVHGFINWLDLIGAHAIVRAARLALPGSIEC